MTALPEQDHLIERAAARLQTANGVLSPEQLSPQKVSIPAPILSAPLARDERPPPGEVTSEPANGAPRLTIAQLIAAGMAIAGTDRTRISEEYRIISDRLQRTATTSNPAARNLIMVTSARPGEGKTFTALNLAATIARTGGRALLADLDVGSRSLSLALGLINGPGLRDLVREPALRPQAIVFETELAGLLVLPRGQGQADRGLIGDISAMIAALGRLSRRFPNHTLVLDTPPALATSDPHALAAHVGQIALVIEAERTQHAEVEAALELLRVCPTITAVLNKSRFSGRNTFGSYDAGYYTSAT